MPLERVGQFYGKMRSLAHEEIKEEDDEMRRHYEEEYKNDREFIEIIRN